MKRACLLVLFVVVFLASQVGSALAQGAPGAAIKRVTLYGPLARKHDASKALFSFKTETYERFNWDINYGSLYVNNDHDWIQVSTAKNVRSAIRDLGAHEWGDSFVVPVVEPFPKLAEGEQRQVSIDVSGKDGEDGAPGADGDGVVRARSAPRRPKHDGVPKVDPIYVKAVVGHIYVLRVVDDGADFYVLFRVEALVRGDNCTISWRSVMPPAA